MTSYYILFVSAAILLLLSSETKYDIFYIGCFWIMVLFEGLRFKIGVDFDSYWDTFNDIKSGSVELFEPINIFIVKTTALFGFGNQLIFLIYSLIILCGVFYFVKKVSSSKELSIFIFLTIGIFYLSTFNEVRQWAAISMMLVAIVHLINKKYLVMLLFIVLACLFHVSAIILLGLVLLNRRYSKSILIIAFSCSVLMSTLCMFIIQNSR